MQRRCAILTNSTDEVVVSELSKMKMKSYSDMLFKTFSIGEGTMNRLEL